MKFPPPPQTLFPFLLWWPLVSRRTLRDDLVAGLTGALIVLPQGVAFATIAGLPAQYGLYAAMVPAIVAALFGSSLHLVSGPTTAISIAIFAALSPHAEPGSPQYIQLVLTLTFLVGLFQLILGLARMGALVNFISHTVVIGFTAGAALLIAASQVKNFFGIDIPRGAPFYEILHQLWLQLFDINPWVLSVSVVTLAAGLLTRRYLKKVPYMIAAMLIGSLFAEALVLIEGFDKTHIVTVGALPAQLPPLSTPDFSLDALRKTIPAALVIAMLALTEAASISRAIAVRSEQRLDANQEFIGQGLSNIAGSFFSGYASSGSFNRSGVNYEAGAKTPLASVFAALFLVVVLFAVAPLAAFLPNAAMAAILFLVAWGLIDFHHIRHIFQTSKVEFAILLTTFVGTLFNLELGIFLGVFLSLILFLYRTSKPEIIPVVPAPEPGAYHFIRAQGRPECPQLRIIRINGAIYFGAAHYVQAALQQIDEANPQQKSVLIAAASLSYVDIAGAEVLAQEARRRRRLGGGLYFYRLNSRIHQFLRQGGYAHEIGEGAFFPVMTDVTRALYWTLNPDVCRSCKTRIFKECTSGILPDGLRRERLMFATDGSEFSHAPGEVAVALARGFGVTLDLVTVVATPEEEEIAQLRLAQAERRALTAGVDVEKITRFAKDAAEAVIQAARDADTNILVIGRRPPRGDLKERLVGDIAHRILLEAPCHVLVVSWLAEPCQRRILMASDGSRISEIMTEITAEIAKALRVPVTVLVAIPPGADRSRAAEDIAEKCGLLKIEGVAAEGVIVDKAPEAAILETAAAIGADLVVIGNDQRKGLARKLVGQTTDRVVGGLRCAVLVVKRPPEPALLSAAVRNQA